MQPTVDFLAGVSGILAVVCGWLGISLRGKADKSELSHLEVLMVQLTEAAKDREKAQAKLLTEYTAQTERFFSQQEKLNERLLDHLEHK